jgi:hypothetical protein
MPGAVPPTPTFYPHSAYPFGTTPGYAHGGHMAIIERPGLPTRRSEMSARAARPGVRHPTELVQYNPNAGNTLSARRPTKPTFQEPTIESEDDEEDELEDDDEDDEDNEEFSEGDEDEFEEDYAEEDDDLNNPIAALKRRLETGNRNMASNRNMDDTQMKVEAARRQAEQRRQQERRQMPPPNVAASVAAAAAAARPSGPKLSMRKTNAPAPQITYGGRHPSENNAEEELRASIRALTLGAAAGSSTTRRPSLASSGGTKATSYSHPGNARITVEGVNRNRRNSYIGSEDRARLEAMHARFQNPEDPHFRNPQQLPRAPGPPPDFSKIIEKAVRDKLNELQLPSTQGAHSKMDLNAQMMAALAYQSRADQAAPRTRDELGELPHVPLTASALRRKTGLPSHTGSSRSKRSSDDGSRISANHRITTGSESGAFTVNGDEMKVRIDTSNGFEMEFEGRRVMLQPVGDGSTADLIIGGKRETAYFSSKGSSATRSQIGSRLTRAPSQREPRERDTRDRDVRERERRERDRARYDDDDDEEDRRTVRGGAGRRRADTYDSEYNRTGQMRRQDRYASQNDYPTTPSYGRPQYSGPAVSGGYIGYSPQPYAPNQGDHVWGA